jgi:hypothetical protein
MFKSRLFRKALPKSSSQILIARGAASAQILGANHSLHHDDMVVYKNIINYSSILSNRHKIHTSPLGDKRVDIHEKHK